jgi:hypothetical protein
LKTAKIVPLITIGSFEKENPVEHVP